MAMGSHGAEPHHLARHGLLGRAPDWIRKDLSAKDAMFRTRAEEALAALISAAISEGEFPADRS
jgi:hypothetical protein